MAVELCASRLIAPYFGASSIVWTNIIGIIMIALALGYLWGGKLADRHPDLKFLLRLILGACLFLFLISFLAFGFEAKLLQLLAGFHSAFNFIFFGSLLATTVLFFIPVFLLGMTSPFLIKLLSKDTAVGDSAGTIFGISTIGSILGTFLPILVFIPLIGTTQTIILFTGLLLLMVFFGLLSNKYWLILFVIIFPGLFLFSPVIKASPAYGNKIYETESSYQYIQVADQGNYRYLIYNDGLGVQSVSNKSGILTGSYLDFYSLLPYLIQNPDKKILIIGLAGGTIADQLKYFFPQAQIDGVEIDPKVITLSREYFNLNPKVNVINQDGRIFLEQTNQKYDLIIVDAYANELYIPFYLTTKEFFGLVSDHLAPGGILAMNVNAPSKNSPLLRAITNTLNVTFDKTYLLEDAEGGDSNYLVLSSEDKLDFGELGKVKNELENLAQNSLNSFYEVFFDKNFMTLTDDKAPVEKLTDLTILAPLLGRK